MTCLISENISVGEENLVDTSTPKATYMRKKSYSIQGFNRCPDFIF
jgi:hypothetical protein